MMDAADKIAPDNAEPAQVPVLEGRQRMEYRVGAAIWLAMLVYFWAWWLKPEHYIGFWRFTLVTAILAWVTLLPAYFIAIFYRAQNSLRYSIAPRTPPDRCGCPQAAASPWS